MKATSIPAMGLLLIAQLQMSACGSSSDARLLQSTPAAATDAPDLPLSSEPGTMYEKIVRDIEQQLILHGPLRVQANMNPKAPGPFQAQYDFVMYAGADYIGLICYQPEEEVRYRLKLKPDEMVFQDKTIQAAVISLAPLSDRVLKAETSPATELEILAWRLMIAAAAPARMQEMLKDDERVDLDAAQALELSRLIFPETPIRSRRTSLRTTSTEEGTELLWGDFGGGIYKTVVAPVRPEQLDEQRRAMSDVVDVKRLPPPPLKNLMQYLAGNGFPAAGEAPIEELFPGQSGLVRFERAGPFQLGTVEVFLGIGQNSPYTGASRGRFADYHLAAQQPAGVTVLNRLEEEPIEVILVLHGQDWSIYYGFDDPSSDVADPLTAAIVNWLQEYRRTTAPLEQDG